MNNPLSIPDEAIGVGLYRISRGELIACESVQFDQGAQGVRVVLCRAAISGRVEVGGQIQEHFADLLNVEGDIVETVALDRKSYGALKNQWMRCKVARSAVT